MFKFSFLISGLWFLIATLAHAADSVGFRQTELGQGGHRPLQVAIWYPTADEAPIAAIGENQAFYGIQAIRDAAPAADVPRPLIVLSHGYGGNWRNLNWLAGALAGQGYIVAAPNHPGTTTRDRDATQATRLWERPRDLSRVVDALTANPALAGKVDGERIAAIGHSLGGWTVTALAGARFDPARFASDCRTNSVLRACSLRKGLALESPELANDMGDSRIRAFVSLDLGLARGFSPESLASLRVPSLVIGAGTDLGGMPAKRESGYLAGHLPKALSTYVEIPDAMHFSFMRPCKPGAAALIEREAPGEGIVCKDGRNRERSEIHREITVLVIGFLARSIPPTGQ